MQRKGRKYKDKTILSYYSNISNKLHSIPKLKKNVKSNVLYSIPSVCMLTLLAGFSLSFIFGNNACYAESNVSLEISNPVLSDTVAPGGTAYLSSNVTYSADEVESYSLQVSYAEGYDSLKLQNSSNTIASTSGVTGSSLSDNTWGFAWGDTADSNNSMTYYAVPAYGTSGTNISTGKLDSGNDSISTVTKKIVFGAKFGSDNTNAGHYTTKVNLLLITTPKKVAEIGEWTLPDGTIKASGITTMQEMTPEVCEQVSTPIASEVIASGKAPIMQLRDSRDESVYAIARYPDGKCWMTQNLAIMGDRTLTSADSNVSSNFTLPASSISGFSSDTAVNAYYTTESSAGATGYYTWCAATAGTCSSATSGGQHAPSSICPKGWRLPGGYNDATYGNEFYNLFNSMGLGITLNTSSNTSWSSTQLDIAQNSNYNLKYTGHVRYSSFHNGTSYGYWWSSTAGSDTYAYYAHVGSSSVYPGTNNTNRRYGFAVRCIAAEPEPEKTFTLTYDGNSSKIGGGGSAFNVPAAQICNTTSGSCDITITENQPTSNCPPSTGVSFLGWSTNLSATSPTYTSGSKITLTDNLTLYAIWSPHSGGVTCGAA